MRPLQLPLQYSDACTQWEVQALTDHTYASGDKIMLHKATQFRSEDPLALAILKNDTSSVLYTGFTLSDYREHVKGESHFSVLPLLLPLPLRLTPSPCPSKPSGKR